MSIGQSLPQTLPATWYTSERFLEVAKLELFDKGWHFVSPVGRFVTSKEENAVQFNFYKNPFFALCDIEDTDIAEIDFYYGVYEDIFSDVEMDDMSKVKKILETLSKVNSVTTKTGLTFVCHEKTPSQTFEDYFGNELTEFIDKKDFRKFPLRRPLVYETDYNFMTFIDGYQECLHCQYTHPVFSKVFPVEFYKVDLFTNFCRHQAPPSTDNYQEGLFLYFFPVCSLNLYGGGLGCFRACPISANRCRMEFDYYFDGSDEEFEEYFKFARQVALEDLDLCEAVQKNLQMGMYEKGVLNPNKEKGVIYYHNLIRNRVMNSVKAGPA